MKLKRTTRSFLVSIVGLLVSPAWAQFPSNPTFTTRALTPFAIEGLTADATGNLYTTGRQPDTNKKCPVWRIDSSGARRTVAFIANNPACNPSGIAFDAVGNLYIADAAGGGRVWRVKPHPVGCASDDSSTPACNAVPDATAFAVNAPGTNGLAFDRFGSLWTGDGTTGRGRVWRISGPNADCATSVNCEEVFRIQPMRNGTALGGDISSVQLAAEPAQGVGRQARTFPHTAANGNPQDLVANGLAFNPDGDLFIADTARGAIWKVEFNNDGSVAGGQIGCDTTFTPNTVCLDTVFVAHPLLEGTDGIALDTAGNIWNSANERNAIVVVTPQKQAIEIFRNAPDGTTGLRNQGPLEFPTSPFLIGTTFCTANSDGNRRDNFPNSGGEASPSGPSRGKISCMDQALSSPGLPLPVE
ncbi:MAG TPA: SMP-30/gluconolactonase/LRE family protein [candidate division Zixibacteria bacterium]|nr:SMP-30/gluconolactonase/LRE family protein [candidate division Zixibacteria bacterium]